MRYSFVQSTDGTDVLDVLGYYNPHDLYIVFFFKAYGVCFSNY